ncbi:MAG: hypothetical protein F6K10_07860 [Moorea sp. SIO2B7]|nr:hypothetical protein [Moorena sp. SIO2B7]
MVVIFFALCTIVIEIGNHVFDYDEDWTNIINLDRELNLPTWYSSFTLAFCAILLAVIAAGKKAENDRFFRQWKILSTIFWILAIDELVSLHEILIIPDLADALHLPGFLYQIWVIPGMIIVLIFILKYVRFRAHLPKRTRYHFTLAAILYIGGALGMEMLGGHYAEIEGQQHLTYTLIATAEEVMEMMGIIVFMYGLLNYLKISRQDLEVQIKFFDGKKQRTRELTIDK